MTCTVDGYCDKGGMRTCKGIIIVCDFNIDVYNGQGVFIDVRVYNLWFIIYTLSLFFTIYLICFNSIYFIQ